MEKITLTLQPSKRFAVFLGIVGGCALFIISWLPIFWLIKIAGIAAVGVYIRRLWRLHGARSARKAVALIWQDARGRWGLQTRGGHSAVGQLKGDSFKGIWFVILRFSLPQRTLSVFIPADALEPAHYRLLSARLRSR